MPGEPLTGDRRCWPCTVANSAIGLTIAWTPLVAMLALGRVTAIPYAAGWGVLVTAYTVMRLYAQGYLPLAEPLAKATGLHTRIGPGARADRGDRSHDRD